MLKLGLLDGYTQNWLTYVNYVNHTQKKAKKSSSVRYKNSRRLQYLDIQTTNDD